MTIDDYMSPVDWADNNPRKVDILRCLANGMSCQQTANELHISYGCVKNTIMEIKRQLKASSTINAVVIAVRMEIIQ